MKLGIVILDWRDEEGTLSSIENTLQWHRLNPTIILVQNESITDKYPQLDSDKIIKCYADHNLGFGGGNNIGISKSLELNLDYTLLINTDAVIEESEVEKLLIHTQENKFIFSIGPSLIESSDTDRQHYIGGRNIAENISTRIKIDELKTQEETAIEVDYVIGAIILFRNKYFDQVGLFDEDYFFSGEVADLCFRAKQLGYTSNTLLTAKGAHHTEDNPLRNTLYKYYSLRNRFIFIRKHQLSNKRKYFWYKLIVKELLHSILTLDKEKLKTMYLTLLDVLKNKKGNRNKLFIN